MQLTHAKPLNATKILENYYEEKQVLAKKGGRGVVFHGSKKA